METEKKSNGALIGSIIIIVILIIGGIYAWQSNVKNMQKVKLQQAQQAKDLQMQNSQTANDLNALDQELNTTDTNVNVNIDKIQ